MNANASYWHSISVSCVVIDRMAARSGVVYVRQTFDFCFKSTNATIPALNQSGRAVRRKSKSMERTYIEYILIYIEITSKSTQHMSNVYRTYMAYIEVLPKYMEHWNYIKHMLLNMCRTYRHYIELHGTCVEPYRTYKTHQHHFEIYRTIILAKLTWNVWWTRIEHTMSIVYRLKQLSNI